MLALCDEILLQIACWCVTIMYMFIHARIHVCFQLLAMSEYNLHRTLGSLEPLDAATVIPSVNELLTKYISTINLFTASYVDYIQGLSTSRRFVGELQQYPEFVEIIKVCKADVIT